MYNAQYFIDKFTVIPEQNWGTNSYMHYNPYNTLTKRCAMGHCGVDTADQDWTEEAIALNELFKKHTGVTVIRINDDVNVPGFNSLSPKERVMTALEYIKKLGG